MFVKKKYNNIKRNIALEMALQEWSNTLKTHNCKETKIKVERREW